MSFGLTEYGFNPRTFEDVKADIIEALKNEVAGANMRSDAKSVFGQIATLMAERYDLLWEAAEDLYASGQFANAVLTALDDLVALANVQRLPATHSVVPLTLGGTAGTEIPLGSIIRDEVTQVEWTTLETVVIPAGESIAAEAEATPAGPIVALAGTAWEIVTPITGWDTVENAEDAVPGRDVETDAALRERYILSFRSGGGSSVESIRAVLLRLDDVVYATVHENDTEYTDSEGRPPHSFEAVVDGGETQDVIDALWASKPAGIRSYGTNTTGTAIDAAGAGHELSFTRPTEVGIFMKVTYSVYPGAADDIETLIRDEVLDYGTALAVGQDVAPFPITQHIETPNIKALSLAIGLSASPTATDPIEVSNRQRAKFNSDDIEFVRVT